VRTPRETTQPNHADLIYWASGLSAIYLEGALTRAAEPPPEIETPLVSPPIFEGPADDEADPSPSDDVAPAAVEAILDPFSVYEKGEALLRRQLDALAVWHLRNIALAYRILPDAAAAEELGKRELVERIVAAARATQRAAPRAYR
jgi:hypothetical protein